MKPLFDFLALAREDLEANFWSFLTETFSLEEEEKLALLLPFALESGKLSSPAEIPWATPRMLAQLLGLSYTRLRELYYPWGKLRRFRFIRFLKAFDEYPLLDRPYRLPEMLLDRLSGLKPVLEQVEELSPAPNGNTGPLACQIVSVARRCREEERPFLLELIGEREAALLALEEALGEIGLKAWTVSLPAVDDDTLGEILREALFEGRLVVLTEAQARDLPQALIKDLGFYLVLIAHKPLGLFDNRLLVPHPPASYLADVFKDCGLTESRPLPFSRRALKSLIRANLSFQEFLLEKYRQKAAGLAIVRKPRRKLADLVLPPKEKDLLEHLLLRLKRRHLVWEEPGLAYLAYPRRGVNVLFSGPPGTGKTLAAEALAEALGLPLIVVDLAGVASKWVGETEKHLRHLFEELVSPETLVVFDEAEALFGRRVESRQAQDRYANMEISYLLQRLEDHRGSVILTTNFEPALDEAFLRRLDLVIRFPFPDEETRAKLWRRFLAYLPETRGLEVSRLARQYHLSGGQIRNVVLTAAHLAGGGPVGPKEIEEALALEMAKLGAMWEGK